jgi:hypothetical protein
MKCKHYKSEISIPGSKTISADRSSKKPEVYKKFRCDHPESLFPMKVIDARSVPCEGDTDNCIIPEFLNRDG